MRGDIRKEVPVTINVPAHARIKRVEVKEGVTYVTVQANCDWRIHTAQGDVYGFGIMKVPIPTTAGLLLEVVS